MIGQRSLRNVKITMLRDFVTPQYIFPMFDYGFNVHRFLLYISDEKQVIVEANLLRKMGMDIMFQVAISNAPLLDTMNPGLLRGTMLFDPWNSVNNLRDLDSEIKSALASQNIFGRKIGAQKIFDLYFDNALTRIEAFEVKTLGIVKKKIPSVEVMMTENGNFVLKEKMQK